MRRCLLTAALCVACLCGCSATRAQPAAEQLAVVSTLYRHFSYEAVLDSPSSDGFAQAPAKVLLRDRTCAAQTRAICRIDFMPLWAAQDAAGMTVSLRWDASANRVRATLRSAGAPPVQISYHMARQQGHWRVTDIDYGPGRPSLLQLLTRPVN